MSAGRWDSRAEAATGPQHLRPPSGRPRHLKPYPSLTARVGRFLWRLVALACLVALVVVATFGVAAVIVVAIYG